MAMLGLSIRTERNVIRMQYGGTSEEEQEAFHEVGKDNQPTTLPQGGKSQEMERKLDQLRILVRVCCVDIPAMEHNHMSIAPCLFDTVLRARSIWIW